MYSMKQKKGTICILMGLLLIVAALSLTLHNVDENKQAEIVSKKVVEKIIEELPENPTENFQNVLYPEREVPAKEIDGYRYIGLLEIPALNITLPVMEEWDYYRLNIAPCCYIGSVYQDNMVIAAHNYLSHFGLLSYLGIGDEVKFTDIEGNVYEYEVAWVENLQPYGFEAMIGEKENDKWDLTLFTCTISGTSRYTVRCVKKEYAH